MSQKVKEKVQCSGEAAQLGGTGRWMIWGIYRVRVACQIQNISGALIPLGRGHDCPSQASCGRGPQRLSQVRLTHSSRGGPASNWWRREYALSQT